MRLRARDPWLLSLVCAFLPATIITTLVVGLRVFRGYPIVDMARDPNYTMHVPLYTGFMSNAGVLLWWAGAVIAIFSFVVQTSRGRRDGTAMFLLAMGALTTALVLDDFYMFHDGYLGGRLGISERYALFVYAVSLLSIIGFFWDTILDSNYVILAGSLLCFAASVVIDKYFEDVLPARHLFEDGSKLFGISAWTYYLFTVSRHMLTPVHVP